MNENIKKIKFEEMIPAELKALIKNQSIAYIPVGSMEWHGPHMAMGTDTTHAYAVATRVSKKAGWCGDATIVYRNGMPTHT